MNLSNELCKPHYLKKLMIESETMQNVVYEVKNGNITVAFWGKNRECACFTDTIENMEKFSQELRDICKVWREVRT